MAVRRSIVKWFDAKKGYGFLVHPDGGTDIFVHYSQLVTERRFKTLRTGQVVDFELHDGPKGVHALNVVEVDEPDRDLSLDPSALATDVRLPDDRPFGGAGGWPR